MMRHLTEADLLAAEREKQSADRKRDWLRECHKNWTTSAASPEAHRFRDDFEGFCKWFLSPEMNRCSQ